MTDIRLWIGYGYELLITMVPAAVLLFIFHSIYKRRNISVTPRHAVYLMIFSFYLSLRTVRLSAAVYLVFFPKI